MIIAPSTQSELVEFLRTCTTLKPSLLKIDDVKWRFAVRAVLRGENLLVRGESGCGKTLLVQTLAKVLDRPYFDFNMGAMQDPRSALIGNTHFASDRGTYVAEALFVKAIQTPYAVILLDEVSRAHPDAHNILMTVLDRNQRYLRIDERDDTPRISVAEGVTFLGTANVGSEYTATRTMDRAFLDRWSVVMVEPLSEKDELELLREIFPDVDASNLSLISQVAEFTRKDFRSESPKLDTIISTRQSVELASMVRDGFTFLEAAEVCIFPFYSDEGGNASPRTYLKSAIQKFIPPVETTGTNPSRVKTHAISDPVDMVSVAGMDLNQGAKTPW